MIFDASANTTFTLTAPATDDAAWSAQRLVFTTNPDGTVTLDHHYPKGYPGRKGVGRFGQRLTKATARKKWRSAVAAGWAVAH